MPAYPGLRPTLWTAGVWKDSVPLLCSDETPPVELPPGLQSSTQEGWGAAGMSPEEAPEMI